MDDKLPEKSLDETKVVESESTKPKSSKITDKAGTEKSVIERSLADNKANSTSGNSTEKHTMALGNAGAFSWDRGRRKQRTKDTKRKKTQETTVNVSSELKNEE